MDLDRVREVGEDLAVSLISLSPNQLSEPAEPERGRTCVGYEIFDARGLGGVFL